MKNKLSWLAGFIDGEGALYIIKDQNRIAAKIEVSNTNRLMMEEVKKILIVNKIEFTTRNHQFKDYRLEYRVYITKQESIVRFCQLIQPFLVGKQRQAQLLIDFCVLRSTKKRGDSWSTEEVLLKEVKNLNKSPKNLSKIT